MTVARFEYRPLPIFEPFHSSPERDRLAVGGYGSGKSVAVCNEAVAWGLEEPGGEWLVTRKTVPALRDTTEKIFLNALPQGFLNECKVARAGGHLEHIQFPNGSIFYFRGMDDWKKHRSLNLTGIVWDEADEFTREDYEGMQSRVRQVHRTPAARALGHTSRIQRRGNVLACNPWGHNWIWEDWINPETRKANTAYWTSTSFDNPFLPRDYIESLLAMPDPWVRRFVLCSFDEFAGAIYPEWSYDTHVVEPFKNSIGEYTYDPASWFRMGFDPGTASGNAGLWVYNDTKTQRLVGVAEYNETGLSVTAHTKAWRRIEATHGMRVRDRIADPKAVNHRDRGSNMKLSDQYGRLGFHFSLGPGGVADRVWGLGELIASGRFVLTSECPRTHEQLLNYRWEDLTPAQTAKGTEAKPLKKDVDLVDTAQYAVAKYVPPPKLVRPDVSDEDRDTLAIHAAIRSQIANGRARAGQRSHDLGSFGV